MKRKIVNSRIPNLSQQVEHITFNFIAFGIPNFLRAKRLVHKLMWLSFIVVCFSMSCYLASLIMSTFFMFEKVTRTIIVYEQPTQFPSISFCSFDRNYFDGKNLQTLINACEFNYDTSCKENSSNHFEAYTDLDFGHCYRFNSGKNMLGLSIPVLRSNIGGMDDSLKLVIESPSGLAVWIHNQSKPIYREYKNNHIGQIGYVSAGSETHFQIDRIVEEKLEWPYNQCLNNVSLFTKNKTIINYIKNQNRSYSKEYCFQLCFDVNYLYEKKCECNASLGNVWSNCFGNGSNHNMPSSSCIKNLKINFYKSDLANNCSEYCPIECQTISLQVTSVNMIDTNINPKAYWYVEKNQSKFFAYYKSLNTMYIIQDSKLTYLDMISNIGGTFSLFIGISFISIIQLLELITEIILNLFEKKTKVSITKK